MSRPEFDKNDPQWQMVYDLEKQLDGIHRKTRTGRQYLRDVAAAVCEKAAIPQVQVVFKQLPGDDLGDCALGVVRLNTRMNCHGVSLYVLLHELSHAICDDYYEMVQSHGPEFCAVFRSLLHGYKILPKACFDVLARQGRVKVQRIEYDFV